MFMVIGFGLLLGEEFLGFIGKPGFDILTAYKDFNWSSFVFNLVFCATTATIVSGAMAERTKFLSYCVYSAVISALIYPIEAHWIWGGGWLAQLGFHDYAGSTAIHMVGGIAALVGAKILGPRIGKFTKTKDGEIKVHAIPGHNLALGCLGCFILWFGWYGFNGAAAADGQHLGQIFSTTTLAPACATVVAMIYTWLRFGKPDVSLSLNGSLAGLVAITAGCDNVDNVGAMIIGAVAGLLLCIFVPFIDNVLKVDDPVGACSVHGVCGCFGTLAVGLFDYTDGLFYVCFVHHLLIQLLGVVCIAGWAIICDLILFTILKKTVGVRVSEREELEGLDATEHGLETGYAGFLMDKDN